MKKLIATILLLAVAAALCACGSSAASSDPGAGLSGYTFYCADENGNPVKGVRISFCTDQKCFDKVSGDDGICNFDQPNGIYDVHVLKAPEGYSLPTETEFKTTATAGTTKLVFPKA